MPGRNDPCPCGSGKKYKNCHQREDESAPRALRLMQGGLGAGGRLGGRVLPLPPGAVVPTEYWEVDLMPLLAEIEDDPTARTTLLMIGAGDFVLTADVQSHPPSEASDVARLLADTLGEVCLAAGKRPTVVLVRLQVLQDELAELLADPTHAAHGAQVVVSRRLVRIDDALVSFQQRAGMPSAGVGAPLVSNPRTWAGWGFAPDATGRMFEAAADYFRAAPWETLWDDDVLTVRLRDGAVWSAVVLGAAGEFTGLALHEDPSDLMRLFDRDEGAEATGDEFVAMRAAVLSLGFESREYVPKSMRDEIKKAKWPIASPLAYPTLTGLNTPGAGVTARQLQAITASLSAILGFVEKHAPAISGEVPARFPLRYMDKATGTSVEMMDPG